MWIKLRTDFHITAARQPRLFKSRARVRTDAHRLGMVVQICTVCYIGRFLGDEPPAVPWEIVEYLAGRLGVEDASCVKRYPERRRTPYEHAAEIPGAVQVPRLHRPQVGAGVPWVPVRAGVDARRGPVALFNHAVTGLDTGGLAYSTVAGTAGSVLPVTLCSPNRPCLKCRSTQVLIDISSTA